MVARDRMRTIAAGVGFGLVACHGGAAQMKDGGTDGLVDTVLDTAVDADACAGLGITSIAPAFAWGGGPTLVTITGTGFSATPKVFLSSAARTVQLAHVAYVSATHLEVVLPSGIPPDTYDLEVTTPNACGLGALRIVANAPPKVLAMTPTRAAMTDTAVTVTGCHFSADAQLSTVDASGTVLAQATSAVSCSGANDARCDNTPVCTVTGTMLVATNGMVAGAYGVRVTNVAENTFGDYASFVVSNSNGTLAGSWISAMPLNIGRRSHASVAGRIDDAHRFVYAVGGEGTSGAALGSVEVAMVGPYGQLGDWFVQKNHLNAARAGLSLVQQGKYLWAIGGTSSTAGTGGATPTGTPLSSIERAKILDSTTTPIVTDPPTTTTTGGTLSSGTWYYKVAAVMVSGDVDNPSGETLASDEVVANMSAAGTVTLAWTAISGANHYRVYRSAAADGISQSEVLLADNLTTNGFVDDGSLTPGVEVPMMLGSTGVWVTSSTVLQHARFNAATVVAPAPNGALNLYVLGGWGACSGTTNGEMNCYESAAITLNGSAIGAQFTADTVHTLQRARQRHAAAPMTAANGPTNFSVAAGATTAFVLVSGGHGITSTGNVEYAVVGSTGTLGSFTLLSGYANERDGSQTSIVNGHMYAILGGTGGQYAGTSDLSTSPILTSTTVTFGAWAAAAPSLGSSVGRFGLAQDSAFFYVIGGTSDDTDALTHVWQIIY